MHVVTAPNNPCFTAKGEGNLNIYPGADHTEWQAAYAPGGHLGFFLNTYLATRSTAIGTVTTEGAGGYFAPLGEGSSWYADAHAGFGWGQRNYYGNDSVTRPHDVFSMYTCYEKYFLQGSVYYKKERVSLAIGLQGALFYFNTFSFRHLLTHSGQYVHSDPSAISFKDGSLININPSVTFQYRFTRNFTWVTQVSVNNYYISNTLYDPASGNNNYCGYKMVLPVSLNCGFHFSFGK